MRTDSEKRAFTEGTLVGMFLFGIYALMVAVVNGQWVLPFTVVIIVLAFILAALV